jgi:predicted permease
MPVLVAGLGLLMGLSSLALVIMVVTAALPMGANVFLFSQRYAVAEELVTASIIVSNAAALFTVPLAMALVGLL